MSFRKSSRVSALMLVIVLIALPVSAGERPVKQAQKDLFDVLMQALTELFATPANPYTKGLLLSIPRLDERAELPCMHVRPEIVRRDDHVDQRAPRHAAFRAGRGIRDGLLAG